MKIVCSIISICFTLICNAQNDQGKISDSIAKVSRAKADIVLKHFDTIKATKILYSLEDKYFYLIIQNKPCHIEYFVSLSSLDLIDTIFPVIASKQTKKQRKQEKQYQELLLKAEPIFDLNVYKAELTTTVNDAKMIAGIHSYFVVKDTNNKRYGEYSLSSVTLPLPINPNLWAYLVRKISVEIDKDKKATR